MYLREFSQPIPSFPDFSRDVAIATNFVSYRTFSLATEVSQDLLDRFSLSLHHMVGIELQMINPTFFFQYLMLGDWGHRELPSGVRGRGPAEIEFCKI